MMHPTLYSLRPGLRLAILACVASITACGGTGPAADGGRIAPERIAFAISEIDRLAPEAMQRTGIPGLAVAVVHEGRTVYARGFGVRDLRSPAAVDADTVFQLASVSKPIGATVVAHQVGARRIAWNTPIRRELPWFTLSSAYVSDNVTIGDLYAHRSGLPDHAGDWLEELLYPRDEIFRQLALLPLTPFRTSYAYTNYGMNGAATAVATAAGTDWATLSEQVLYRPLGMASTSSRFADFRARPNRAVGHVVENGVMVVGAERAPGTPGQQFWNNYHTDIYAPTGGASSSASDMARWMAFVLAVAGGTPTAAGAPQIPPEALLPALSPQATTFQAGAAGQRSSYYGFGFNVSSSSSGRTLLSHNGALAWGASTSFALIPSYGVGIVVLTNAIPNGVADGLTAHFNDLVEFGAPEKDWLKFYGDMFAAAFKPQGALVGQQRPVQPVPPQPLSAYLGTYRSNFYGVATVVAGPQGTLEVRLGPAPHVVFPLRHWSGDVFTFVPSNDNAPAGSISRADFTGGALALEHFNHDGLGVFARAD